MKLFYFDLETTGVKYWQNGIHQISGAIELDGEVKEEFNYKVKPNPSAKIEDEALDIAGITRNDLESYTPMSDVYNSIIGMLSKYVNKYDKSDKMFLVGYNNAHFDNPFFRAFFVQNGDKYFGSWFWSSPIDVMVLAAEYLKHERSKMVNFKLNTVAEKLGIIVDDNKLHDALYDIELTREIYSKVTTKN